MKTAGIIGNTNKENLHAVLDCLLESLLSSDFKVLAHADLAPFSNREQVKFAPLETLGMESDFIISIGGDGTLLASSVTAHQYNKPIVGVNLGKLGFLAEITTSEIPGFIKDIREKNFCIERRTVLEGIAYDQTEPNLLAFNDIVIEKGGWPKMVEISIGIDNRYVTTFSADGVIVSTPAGSTGYSMSSGGPIVSPTASVISIIPISAHSLTMRPLIISADQKIQIHVRSPHTHIQVNCDGQRVKEFSPDLKIDIGKSDSPLQLLRSCVFDYFQVLRSKFYWGLDVRYTKQ